MVWELGTVHTQRVKKGGDPWAMWQLFKKSDVRRSAQDWMTNLQNGDDGGNLKGLGNGLNGPW